MYVKLITCFASCYFFPLFKIGKGSFGEIFLASDDTSRSVTTETAKYVAKIEPHSNGPLFVEIHCLLSTAKATGNLVLMEII